MSRTRSEAECLWYEDDPDAAGRFVMDDQCLGQEAAGIAERLHSGELSRKAVFAYTPEPFVQVADEFLMTDHDASSTN